MVIELDFNAWLKELERVAALAGIGNNLVGNTGEAGWEKYFNNGMTPAEALIADINSGF